MRTQRRDGTFKAVDGFGRNHTIEIFTEILAEMTEGAQTFVTAEGESVERIAKGKYRIVQGGTELTSKDPAAP